MASGSLPVGGEVWSLGVGGVGVADPMCGNGNFSSCPDVRTWAQDSVVALPFDAIQVF